MSRFDLKEFGEAAPFLRKSDLELLSKQTVAFDGRPNKDTSKKRNLIGRISLKIFISSLNIVLNAM